jgi:hypothetical protein
MSGVDEKTNQNVSVWVFKGQTGPSKVTTAAPNLVHVLRSLRGLAKVPLLKTSHSPRSCFNIFAGASHQPVGSRFMERLKLVQTIATLHRVEGISCQ